MFAASGNLAHSTTILKHILFKSIGVIKIFILLQQLQAKYGNPNIPGVNEFIKSAVRDFVASHDNILAAEAMVSFYCTTFNILHF